MSDDEQQPLIPEVWADQLKEAMEPGPLTRYLLRHQHQEYTDTTAAYEAGEDVVPGDCWRACLASLLEVPLADVPHFIHLHPDDRDPEPGMAELAGPWWWRESQAWVERVRPGWTIAAWEREGYEFPTYGPDAEGAPDRVIVTAPSPRGNWNHSALYYAQDGTLAHDPFPDGQGVLDGPGDVVAVVRLEWLAVER